MYTVYAISVQASIWPPSAKKIHRQGRPGKNPRKVVGMRVNLKYLPKHYTLAG